MKAKNLAGIITPVLTPFNDDGSVCHDLYYAHCKWVIEQGSDYISPFGTTGEALSLSLNERIELLSSLIEDNHVAAERIMPGTGLCSMPETFEMTKLAVDLGCKAVMTLPPFFYKNANDQGLFEYFSELIGKVADKRLKICLYHIPPMAGMGFSAELTASLNQAYPDTVVAYKDSSGDWANTQNILSHAPDLSVFPGSEAFLLQGLQHGTAGCISATCNINARNIREVFDLYHNQDHRLLQSANQAMVEFRNLIQDAGLISMMKALLAKFTRQPCWQNVRLPLLPSSEEKVSQLIDELGPRLNHLKINY